MTTIIYTKNDNKVIEIRHVGTEDLEKELNKFINFEIVKNYEDIRKINEQIDTQEWIYNDIRNR